jgi:hypothetical protein
VAPITIRTAAIIFEIIPAALALAIYTHANKDPTAGRPSIMFRCYMTDWEAADVATYMLYVVLLLPSIGVYAIFVVSLQQRTEATGSLSETRSLLGSDADPDNHTENSYAAVRTAQLVPWAADTSTAGAISPCAAPVTLVCVAYWYIASSRLDLPALAEHGLGSRCIRRCCRGRGTGVVG